MSRRSTPRVDVPAFAVPAVSIDALFTRFVEEVAARVADHLRDNEGAYYTQKDNPLGRRPFLEAARRGDFVSMKRGKLVCARREDVDRWIADGQRPVTARSAAVDAPGILSDAHLDAMLADAGIRTDGVPSRRRRRA